MQRVQGALIYDFGLHNVNPANQESWFWGEIDQTYSKTSELKIFLT